MYRSFQNNRDLIKIKTFKKVYITSHINKVYYFLKTILYSAQWCCSITSSDILLYSIVVHVDKITISKFFYFGQRTVKNPSQECGVTFV